MHPPAQPSKILIHNVSLVTEPATALLHDQWLLLQDNIIHSFGKMEDVPRTEDVQHIDGSGKLAMPGLINAHNHSAMTLFRGMADDLDLGEWLNEHIFPAEAKHVKPEMVYCCSKLAAAEMILSGTTTVADGYFHEEQAARAFFECGMRAVPSQGIIDFPAPGVPDPAGNIAAAERFLLEWQNKSSRITPALFAHSPYTCSPDTLQNAKALARQYKTTLYIHTAESRHEQQLLLDPQGSSPVRHLAALGILDSNTVLIHCVWLDDKDRKIIAESECGIIICPHSHCKLASGIAEVTEMKEQRIKTGLGTDGCASNNTLDMFREMDLLAKSQKMRTLDATAIPAAHALAAATSANAKIIGQPKLGRIAEGCLADIILLDMAQPHLQPCYSQDFLSYNTAGSDVNTVIIDGKIILQDRKFLSFDVEQCMAEVRTLARDLGAF
ncbi:MAG: amidohydrolase [Desulfocapsa sp.]|nr:MAG: amidohydrolase [Desulfocapsa sp.]